MKLKVHYRNSGGTSRTRTGLIGMDFPDHAWNAKDGQAHPLDDDPRFPITRPYAISTFDELVAAPMIPPTPSNGKYAIFCEDQGFWPYSCNVIQTREEMERRQRRREDWQEAGRQHVENKNIQQSLGNSLLTYAGMVLVGGFCLILLLISLIVLNSLLGGEDEAAAAVALPIFFSTVTTIG